MDIVKVDARGLSCPEPVMKTKAACDTAKGRSIEILVDSEVARDNCKRYAEHAKYVVAVKQTPDGDYCLTLSK